MKRVLIACLVACGSPQLERAPTPKQASPTTPADARVDAVQIVDTSIATVWAAPPAPAEIPPHVPRNERGYSASEVPRARRAGRRAPCFANRDVLVGYEVWQDLRSFAISMDQEPPPSGRYGTCTIKDGQLRDARGTLVADLHCGITVHVPGIIDDAGFEVGASGADVATREHHSIACSQWLEGKTRCVFLRTLHDDAGAHYIVDRTPPIDDGIKLVGDEALAFMRSRTVTTLTVRITCH